MTAEDADKPIACTLAPAQYKHRISWIRELGARSLRHRSREDLKLLLVYDATARELVERLVEWERACCPFLSFHLSQSGETVELTITAPADARETAHLLFEEFVSGSDAETARSACGCS